MVCRDESYPPLILRETFFRLSREKVYRDGHYVGDRMSRGQFVCRHCMEEVNRRAFGRHLRGPCGNAVALLSGLRRGGIVTDDYRVYLHPFEGGGYCLQCGRRLICFKLTKPFEWGCGHCGLAFTWTQIKQAGKVA